MTEWISVKERLPKENTKVLCYYYNNNIDVVEYWGNDEKTGKPDFFSESSGLVQEASHWMPLPKPPEFQS